MREVVQVVLALLLITTGASASAQSAHSAVETLLEKAVDLNVDIDNFKQEFDCDAIQRLGIYLGTESAHLTPVDVALRVDDQTEIHHSFNESQQTSLGNGALYQFSCLKITNGSHHLHAEVSVHDPAAVARTELHRLSYDGTLEKSQPTLAIELLTRRTNYLSEPEIYLRSEDVLSKAPAQHTSSLLFGRWSQNRLHQTADGASLIRLGIGYAKYLSADQKPFSALTLLKQLALDHPDSLPSFEFDRELASDAINLGMWEAAASASKQAVEAGAPKPMFLTLQLQLALSFYNSGELARAADELTEIGPSIPKKQLSRWQDIYSRVLLAEGEFDKAAKFLIHVENNADYESLVRYYNLGIALIKNNHPGQGITILDRIGEITSNDLLLARLRDKANLTLGYYFLAQLQGATAIPIFERVSRDGPMSSQALLGLGWAWLAPSGSAQEKQAIGDERTIGPPPESVIGPKFGSADQNLYQRYDLIPFERAHTSNDSTTRLQRALIPWAELEKRDASDPAIDEGMLAIARALEELNAHDGARDEYEKALSVLDENERKLNSTIKYVASDQWIDALIEANAEEEPGGKWGVAELPPSQFAIFLESAIASNEFQQTIQDYRMLFLLEQFFKRKAFELKTPERSNKSASDNPQALLLERIDSMLSEINVEKDVQRKHACRLALDELQSRQFRNQQLLDAAHFSLARVYDRRPLQ